MRQHLTGYDEGVNVDNFVEIGDFSVFPHFLRVCF